MSDSDDTKKTPLNRRSFMATVLGGAAVAGGASALITGQARAQQRPTGNSDNDSGSYADPAGYGATGVSDSDPYDAAGYGVGGGGGGGGYQSGLSDSDPVDPGGNGRGQGTGLSDSDPSDSAGYGYSGMTDSDSGSNADAPGHGRGNPRG